MCFCIAVEYRLNILPVQIKLLKEKEKNLDVPPVFGWLVAEGGE